MGCHCFPVYVPTNTLGWVYGFKTFMGYQTNGRDTSVKKTYYDTDTYVDILALQF